MLNLIKAINGHRPFLVDYQIAKEHLELKSKQGFTDLLSHIFGETPKPLPDTWWHLCDPGDGDDWQGAESPGSNRVC